MTSRFTDHFKGPDTHANLPDVTTVPVGCMYVCSTHKLIYKSDGTAWATWADLNGTVAATDPEVVRDSIAAALVAGSDITITVNDAGDTITISSAPSAVVLNAGQTVAQYQTANGVTVPIGTLIARKA